MSSSRLTDSQAKMGKETCKAGTSKCKMAEAVHEIRDLDSE